MEDAGQALKMAAAVLVFTLALTICITSFSEARRTTQILINSNDREYNYGEQDYVTSATTTHRIVGAETIVPTIYKAYKENYKIIFKDRAGQALELYEKADPNNASEKIKVYAIDLEKDVVGTNEEKEEFIRALLWGSKNRKHSREIKKIKNLLERKQFL